MESSKSCRVVVAGAGAIGTSIAWYAQEAGFSVTLVDEAPGSGASAVAGGMLAPVTEAWPGEETLTRLGVESLNRWPHFAERLQRSSGSPTGLRTDGTLLAATDAGDLAELDRLATYLDHWGMATERLTAREVRVLEPTVARIVRGALAVPGEHAVDNRALLPALNEAARRAGVRSVAGMVETVQPGSVRLRDGSTIEGDVIVVAAGVWSGHLHEALRPVIRPVKGEILRLRVRPGAPPPPRHTIRAIVGGRPVYLVPRTDGELVVGATQYEAGFDREVTVGGVRDLLHDAERVLPALSEYALTEAIAGLRPGSPDNRPLIGWLEPGVLAATGHHRNGLLLTPLTADLVTDLLTGATGASENLAAVDPTRFTVDPDPDSPETKSSDTLSPAARSEI